METWKPIVGHEECYQVSDLGRVRSVMKKQGTHPGRTLKPKPHNAGYLVACLYGSDKPSYRLIHTLVLEAFVGPRPDGVVAHHIDGDKHNNRLDNLTWFGNGENIAHAYRVLNTASRNRPKGELHGESKLTAEQVLEMRRMYATGEYSQTTLATKFGIVQPHVSRIIRGESWAHLDHNHSE